MTGFSAALGARIDTWGGSARQRRFRSGWPSRASRGVAFFNSDKVQFRYRVEGAGRTIVFAADPPMTLENYDALIESFSPHFRVVVFELPAMGFSAVREDFGFGFRESNDEVAAFLRAVAGERAILAFSCVASLAAVDIADRFAPLVSALMVIQAGDPAAFEVWKTRRDPKGVLARPVFGQFAMKQLAPSRMPAWYKLSVGRKEQIPALCACASRSFEHGAMWSLASAYQIYMDKRVRLAAPSQPVLSIWGGADGSHPRENMHAICRLAPHGQKITFDDLGHTPELEDPARVLDAITRFIAHA